MAITSSLVSYWCTIGFLEINNLLRTGEVSDRNRGDEEYMMEDAQTLIAAAQSHYSGIVYRGIAGECDGTYSDKGLSSWTTHKEMAETFARKRSEQTGKPALLLTMDAAQGFDIQAFLEERGEESSQCEILIAPGSYKVEVEVL